MLCARFSASNAGVVNSKHRSSQILLLHGAGLLCRKWFISILCLVCAMRPLFTLSRFIYTSPSPSHCLRKELSFSLYLSHTVSPFHFVLLSVFYPILDLLYFKPSTFYLSRFNFHLYLFTQNIRAYFFPQRCCKSWCRYFLFAKAQGYYQNAENIDSEHRFHWQI